MSRSVLNQKQVWLFEMTQDTILFFVYLLAVLWQNRKMCWFLSRAEGISTKAAKHTSPMNRLRKC